MGESVSEEPCSDARAALLAAHDACLVALGNHYGYPACATPADVRDAVNTLARLAFDAGADFARASMIPPPPTDAEVISAAETLIRSLRRG